MSTRHQLVAGTGPLHVVSDAEAEVRALRALAWDRFGRRYRHNDASRHTMTEALERFVQISSTQTHRAVDYPWELMTDEILVEELWAQAVGDRSRNTALKWATAIRVMLDCCRRVGLLTTEQYKRVSAFETKGVGTVRPKAGRYLSQRDVNLILEACDEGPGGHVTRIRDRALISTMASSGIRSVEITGLNLNNLVDKEAKLDLVITKGGRPREAWLHSEAIAALDAWLVLRGRRHGPLFVPLSRTGRPLLDRGALSYRQVWDILRRRAQQAGLGVVTPHDLRRFLITTLLGNGYDLVLVCQIAGHVRPETTAGYDRRPAAAQRAAIESLEFRPFVHHARESL